MMFKQSPQRNQRNNNGLKVKQALKICLLLAVSIWLLYQVWHSWNKSTTRGSTKISESQNIIKLGRKELQGQFRESEMEEDVQQKEVQDVESKHDEHQVDQERVEEDSEPGAQKSNNDEGKETDIKEEETGKDGEKDAKENKDEGDASEKEKEEGKNETENSQEAEENKENGSAESTEENGITGLGDNKANGNEEPQKNIYEQSDATNNEDSKKNGSELMQKKCSEENDTTQNVDSKGNGSEEALIDGNESNDDTSNGDREENRSDETQQKNNGETDTAESRDGKENGSEKTKDKSNEDNRYTGNGERKKNKEGEGESKGSEEEKLGNEKLVESKSHGETNIDEESSEDGKEKETIVEDAGAPESQMSDRNEAKGEVAREGNRDAEENTSSEKKTPNESETQEDKENSPSGERMMNNGKEVVDEGRNNSQATGENQNGSGMNMTESATVAKNDSAILPEGEKNNSFSLLEMKDNFNQTTETTQSKEQLTMKGQSADAPGRNSKANSTSDNSENQNTTTEDIIPFANSTQSILEKHKKTEKMSYGESTGSDLSPTTTDNHNSVNGVSVESLSNDESVVVQGQSANFGASNKGYDEPQRPIGNEHIDTVPNKTFDTRKSVTQEYHGSSKGNADVLLGDNNTLASIPTPTTQKEVSSNSNGSFDAGNHNSVTQDEKQA